MALSAAAPITTEASPQLLATIRAFLDGKPYEVEAPGIGAKSSGKRLG